MTTLGRGRSSSASPAARRRARPPSPSGWPSSPATEHLALIKLDSYYVDLGDRPLEEREAFNYDHPDAFDWPLLNDHLAALAAGAPVPVPVYDYVEYNRSGDVRIVHPAQIVVVEGILVLWEPTLRERFDLKVFVDTDADLRLIRRLRRDVAERGRTAESVIEQYLDDGAPGARAVHRAEQALRRRDHPPRRPQPPGARRPARPRARAGRLRIHRVRVSDVGCRRLM